MAEGEIINRVKSSGIIQLDMGDFFSSAEIVGYDLAQNLWQGIALREKDFREFIKTNDWDQYQGKHVAIYCSADAIVPSWAYMLVASSLNGLAKSSHFGEPQEVEQELLLEVIAAIDPNEYEDARVVIKGCGDKHVSEKAWMAITNKLKPVVRMLMYGEPCSTVPIFKKPR